jgi:radical SAM/Cys-rich protein
MNKPISIKTPVEVKLNENIPSFGPSFQDVLAEHDYDLRRSNPSELQINLGKLCNLACHHCHVDAGPKRTEIMTWDVMGKILNWVKDTNIRKADLTGGAPELNPHFRQFCDELLKLGFDITSRCNITVLYEPGQEDLAKWYAERKIKLVCSLPCYSQENVDAQRGKGTFDLSVKGLQELNSLGYGIEGSDLQLDLVYNPNGYFLPPAQQSLEQDYRKMLDDNFGISFSNLLTITNIPINRFAHSLVRDNQMEDYQQLLLDNFNAATLDGLMCRHLISVDWLGYSYDCDFNQMLDMPIANQAKQFLWDIESKTLDQKAIATNRHCFGCTAGAGSSCGGSLT